MSHVTNQKKNVSWMSHNESFHKSKEKMCHKRVIMSHVTSQKKWCHEGVMMSHVTNQKKNGVMKES